MTHKALITLNDVGEELLNAIYIALKPEESFKVRGVNIALLKTQSRLIIIIEAPTLNLLRATINSTMRLTKLIIDIVRDLR